MNPLQELGTEGQAVWLDFLARGFIAKGDLKRMMEEDAVHGVTSNPSIFEKAIGHSDEYDSGMERAQKEGDVSVGRLYEGLAIEDIRAAADVLKPVYDKTDGADGYVSLEVSPYLALDTQGTIDEAHRLWKEVDRKNLMIKVPATEEGLPAIRDLIGDGINVNITLLFAQSVYEQVVEAYISGLEKLAAKGGDVSKIASVASFFVSRIDTAADNLLDQKIAEANDTATKEKLQALKGKVAIANAKLAYQRYKDLFTTERWKKLEAAGAKRQRLLWASTGTKNKAYSDVLYIEQLIGEDTVNTMPPATLEAFRDHGKVRPTLEEDVDEARRVLADLDAAGISLDAITKKLVEEGVQLFADAFDKLLGAVAGRRETYLGPKLNTQEIVPCDNLKGAYAEALEAWRKEGLIRRLWKRDTAVWSGADEDKWLGWLDSIEHGLEHIADYEAFAADVKGAGFESALLLGMGGSSLGPEVLAMTFGSKAGFPKLHIVDSTDPAQVARIRGTIDPAKTLFIVSSKSGSTTEPNVLKDFFFEETAKAIGRDRAGSHFVAVTDPGSSMEKVAREQGFRHVFHGVPSIGGRYSVLSPFGLVPAAAMGLDLRAFLVSARSMAYACGTDVPPEENPGVQLGLMLGISAKHGRDKATVISEGKFSDFGAWAEQLIAESTGKLGKGIIPVAEEPLTGPDAYGSDRIFLHLHGGGEDSDTDARLKALQEAGHPVVWIEVGTAQALGQEFFRWEMATAVAGAVLGINPFDQPDVEAAKVKTRELTAAFEKTGALPSTEAVFSDERFALFTDERNARALREAGAGKSVESWLKAHFARLKGGDYAAFLAFIDHNEANTRALQEMRVAVRDARRTATCVGFGPRFLHSTGQAYKGGPDSGVFLQITGDAPDLAVPGQKAGFGTILAAQARGDFGVLLERGRRALSVHVKGDTTKGLADLAALVAQAVR